MKRKGISPLIAAVLLIAFTMAVASIFAQWAPQLIQDAQGDTKNQTENIQRCSGNVIEITSFSQSSDEATIQQTAGEEGIGNMTVTWYYDTANPEQNYAQISSPRGVVTKTAPTTGNTITQVTVDPIDCEGAPSTSYEP